MLPSPHTLVWLLAIAAAIVILRLVGWRVLLVARPASIRIRSASGTFPPPEGFDATASALREIGFVPLGVRLEHPRLGRAVANFDFAHPAMRTYATVYRAGRSSRLYFLSPLESGEMVLTQAAGLGDGYSGRLAEHRQRCGGRERAGAYDAAERAELARAWFEGPGVAAVRRQQLAPVLWSLVTLGMVLWALLIHL